MWKSPTHPPAGAGARDRPATRCVEKRGLFAPEALPHPKPPRRLVTSHSRFSKSSRDALLASHGIARTIDRSFSECLFINDQPNFLRCGCFLGCFSGTNLKATVASAGNVQLSCVATVAVPDP